jgi:ankyrin repeat protein
MKYVELAHFTVKEFLLSIDPKEQTSVADYRIEIPRDHSHLAKVCLSIINFDEFAAKPPPQQTDRLSWAASTEIQEAFRYACEWWPTHAYEHLGEETISALIRTLFRPVKSNNFLWWAKYFVAQNRLILHKYPEITTLHFAAILRLSGIVEWLLKQEGVDVNSASQIGPPILFALSPIHAFRSYRGSSRSANLGLNYWHSKSSDETVKVLLERGAQVNRYGGGPWAYSLFRSGRKDTLLGLAISQDNPSIVNMLLARGARITSTVIEECHSLMPDSSTQDAVSALLEGVTIENVDQDARESLAELQSKLKSLPGISSDTDPDEEQEGHRSLPLVATTDMASKLKTAASNGQLEEVGQYINILERSSDDKTKSDALQMALHLAARYHRLSVVEILLQHGASTNHQDDLGDTPLHQACIIESACGSNGFQIIELFLRRGSDPAASNRAGLSPLHIAAKYMNADSVAILKLLTEASPDSKSLLEHGILQPSPFWVAIERGCDEVARFFLGMSDINTLRGLVWKKSSCLVPAIQRDSSAILEVLIEKGVDVNSPVRDGSLAIHHASGPEGSLAAMKFLLIKGSDLATKRKDGSTVLHLTCETPSSDSIEKMKALLSAGADINSSDARGRSVLQVAVAHYSYSYSRDILSFLVKQEGLDINHKDHDGQTAMMMSLQSGLFKVSDILMAHGCDLKAMDTENRTALHYACEKEPSESSNQALLKLIEAGLQLSEKDSKSISAFEFALYSKDLAPPAFEKPVDNVPSAKEQRKTEKSSVNDLWAPFTEFSNDVESDIESDPNIDPRFDEHILRNTKIEFDENTQNFWQFWNERIVMCMNHMTSDQLDRRLSTGRYPISLSIQYGTSTTTKLMLEKDVNVNAMDTTDPAIPLDIAAIHGCDSETAALLIARTRRPIDEFTGSQRRNPLQLCCAHSNSNLVLLRQLLAANASTVLPDRDGVTPLMIAAGHGSLNCLKFLLKHKVPLDEQIYGSGPTALHCAIIGSSPECALALLEAGARVDLKSEIGTSFGAPLLSAAVQGMWDIAEILIKHQAPASTLDVSGGTSVVHEAAAAGEERILKMILDLPERPEMNTKNKDRATPLELAAANGATRCFQLLLDNGASIDTGIELNGSIAHASIFPLSNDIRNLLLHRDINWNVPALMECNNVNYIDVFPLHRAAYNGNNTCIHFLKEHNLFEDINMPAEYGMTALHFAACKGREETVDLLLQFGADPEKTETRYRRTPLISAARFGRPGVVTTLLDHGCNTLAKDAKGCTAYIHAIKEDKPAISELLKRHEARVTGTLPGPDIPAAPDRGVSFADDLLSPRSIRRSTGENQDSIQLIRAEVSEIKRLLSKAEPNNKADQSDATESRTDTGMKPEDAKEQETISWANASREVRGIMVDRNYLMIAMIGAFMAFLCWVIISLIRVNRVMIDFEKYIQGGILYLP